MRRITRRTRLLTLALATVSAASAISVMAASAGASAAARLTASFTLSWNWGSGYEAGYTITNDTSSAISGWAVAFDLPAGQQMGNYWNALETASGTRYTFTNRNYNGTVPAGGTATFGFIVTGAFSPPVHCPINGTHCRGGSPPPPASPPTPPPSPPPLP